MPNESQRLKLTPGESLWIVSSDSGALVVEATYGAAGEPPPKHLHPAQDESFEILEGSLHVKVKGDERVLEAGETIVIPRGTSHQMWNAAATAARVRWTTSPAGRTEEWFRALDSLQQQGKVDGKGLPAPLSFARVAAGFEDTFRLAVGPDFVSRGAIRALALVGRLRGA